MASRRAKANRKVEGIETPTTEEFREFFGCTPEEYQKFCEKADAVVLRDKGLLHDEGRKNQTNASKQENTKIGRSILKECFPEKEKRLPGNQREQDHMLRCFVIRRMRLARRRKMLLDSKKSLS
jgi:hypothetical protein